MCDTRRWDVQRSNTSLGENIFLVDAFVATHHLMAIMGVFQNQAIVSFVAWEFQLPILGMQDMHF